jgi:hypothetical protein
MRPTCSNIRLLLALLITIPASAIAQDIPLHVYYVCNGERIFIEGCNIRDTSDNGTCMVEHPDHTNAGGIAAITSETRGSLKKRLPACQQPTAQQLAAAAAAQKKQQAIYDANEKKANDQLAPAVQQFSNANNASGIAPPKNAEERAMRRCISSGRLPASCTGNQLLGAFAGMLSSVLGSDTKTAAPSAGPDMSGVYQGAGNWRLDFIDGGVLVNCSGLSPNQESYRLNLAGAHPELIIATRPKPLVLTVRADGTIVGPPGPVTIDGVVAGGYTPGTSTPGHSQTSTYNTTERMNNNQVQPAGSGQTISNAGGGFSDVTTTHSNTSNVGGSSTPGYTNFVSRRATCPAINLANKGGTGIQTMQTDLLKSMFSDGDKGAPTPAGIRMHGIYANASTGFSAQFFPESVILGCGPDVARAYPYTVEAEGTHAVIKVAAPDHPLTLAMNADNSLDPGATGPYLVHGRIVTGQNQNDDFTFAPMEKSCNLAALTPAKEIPPSGGVAAAPAAPASSNNGGLLSTFAAPLGNATLAIVSGLPPQPGVPNALAGHPMVLLRQSYADTLARGGIVVPAGTSPYKFVADTCAAGRTPACQNVLAAVNASAISAARADANGSVTLPGVPPGTYYLMISTRYNNQGLAWGQAIQLKPGANSITLSQKDATPIN